MLELEGMISLLHSLYIRPPHGGEGDHLLDVAIIIKEAADGPNAPVVVAFSGHNGHPLPFADAPAPGKNSTVDNRVCADGANTLLC